MKDWLARIRHSVQPITADLYLPEFTSVQEFHLTQREEPQPGIDLVMLMENKATKDLIGLVFEDVRDLHMARDGWKPYVIDLAIRGIAERQWDDLKWEVSDREKEIIHFFCHTVSMGQVR
jgi:hypothetical protein